MIELSKISFSTISYVTEELNLVLNSLKSCFPEDLRDIKFNLTKIQSQFGDQLVIVDYEFVNKDAIKVISYLAKYISEKDKNYLFNNLERKTDMEDREFHLRLNKFLPLSDIITLADGSDVIKVKIKYQVFTSQHNTLENVRNCLGEVGLIQV
ncbi:MAG: RNA-binding domain-containing protein [Candidatus Kariarchaeaceae archaeon]|jgi:RNA binding exosome subunit